MTNHTPEPNQLLHTIRQIEEITANAWPAPYSMYYDGWVLRYAQGYTRRANSVFPFYGSSLDIDEKLAYCEAFYRARQLPSCFKLTEAVTPSDLDDLLKQRGYQSEGQTSVQFHTLDSLPNSILFSDDALDIRPYAGKLWIDAFLDMRGVSGQYHAVVENILLNHILPPSKYVMVWQGAMAVAIARLTFERGYMGIFDVVVHPQQRGMGIGKQFLTHLLHIGKQQGAQMAYLQVEYNNETAFGMYQTLGFRSLYRYWYRTKK